MYKYEVLTKAFIQEDKEWFEISFSNGMDGMAKKGFSARFLPTAPISIDNNLLCDKIAQVISRPPTPNNYISDLNYLRSEICLVNPIVTFKHLDGSVEYMGLDLSEVGKFLDKVEYSYNTLGPEHFSEVDFRY